MQKLLLLDKCLKKASKSVDETKPTTFDKIIGLEFGRKALAIALAWFRAKFF